MSNVLIIALLIDHSQFHIQYEEHNIHPDNISQPFSQNFDHKQRMLQLRTILLYPLTQEVSML